MENQEKAKSEMDEKYFMNMMAGSNPVPNETKQEPVPIQEHEKPKEPPKSKRTKSDYEALFLKRNELTNRRSTYISAVNHEKLTQLVNCIGEGNLSVGGFIDNLLTQHFEEYKTEISNLFDQKFSKLF